MCACTVDDIYAVLIVILVPIIRGRLKIECVYHLTMLTMFIMFTTFTRLQDSSTVIVSDDLDMALNLTVHVSYINSVWDMYNVL